MKKESTTFGTGFITFSYNNSISANCLSDSFMNGNPTTYINEISSIQNLINRFNSIDEISIKELSENKDFNNFLNEALEIINSANTFSNVKVEYLDNFDRKAFRILYHLRDPNNKSSSISDDLFQIERPIYKKLLKHLFRKSIELKEMMVLDERSF